MDTRLPNIGDSLQGHCGGGVPVETDQCHRMKGGEGLATLKSSRSEKGWQGSQFWEVAQGVLFRPAEPQLRGL